MNYDIETMVVLPYIKSNDENGIRTDVVNNILNMEVNFSKIYYLLSKHYPSRTMVIEMLNNNCFLNALIRKIQGGF